MREIVLLTGGTGFLGTELASRLAKMPDVMTCVLVRASDNEEALHRLKGAWFHDKELYESIGKNMLPVPGDFTKPGLGLSEEDRRILRSSVTLVIHSGAEIGFNK
ncbi:MAG: SDR family oxidoreductase, partial [Firmicutes bacterium]|nr:SDR family oxidoreductase [Bacillota bacterium]